MVGLAAVYLNEYRVASTAFTLHSQEPKVLKVWREQISKAKEIYQEAKSASRCYQVSITIFIIITYFESLSVSTLITVKIRINFHQYTCIITSILQICL